MEKITIILNPDQHGVATTLKADHFNWQHITRPKGGYRRVGILELIKIQT